MMQPFFWIVVAGVFVSFLTGAGMGMNDLSNAFGTTYGARVLTLPQIVLLASICELAGALSLGGAVTATISGGIANIADFVDHPYMLMYGMLCAGGAAFCWLSSATWLMLPVSSTHSICGGVMGFALVYGGAGSVNWAASQAAFPFVRGVAPIIASWFISPLLTGAVAATIFAIVRRVVLRPENSVQRAILTLPIIVAITFFFESFFIIYKGAESSLQWGVGPAACVAMSIGVGAGLFSCCFVPLLKQRVGRLEEQATELAEEHAHMVSVLEENLLHCGRFDELPLDSGLKGSHEARESGHTSPAPRSPPRAPVAPAYALSPSCCTSGRFDTAEGVPGAIVRDDDAVEENDVALRADRSAVTASGLEVQLYNPRVEMVYRYLQILTAVCASFAHGASDVSNAVGPFAAIISVYRTGEVQATASIPFWVLGLGGAGLVVGLATFGVRLMRLLGEQITVITPVRGFSAELSAAFVVSFASAYGIPVSSTHCITGAVVGISMMDVGARNVRWAMVLKMYGGWIFTLVFTATLSAIFFAQGINAPSRCHAGCTQGVRT